MAGGLDDLGFEDETELLQALEFEEEQQEEAAAGPPGTVPAKKAPPKDPGLLRTVGSSLLQGFFKGGSDEASAAIGALKTGTPMPGATWRETGESLKTQGDVYRALRDSERRVLEGAQEHNPKTAFVSSLLGDIGSDVVAAGLGLPGVGSKPYNIATGALSGLLGSDAELTPDKATGKDAAMAAGSTALGGALGYVMPKVGEKLAGMAPTALRALRNVADKVAVSQGRRVLLNGADSLSNRLPTSEVAVLEAIDSGAIVPFGTTQGAFKRLERLADERGTAYAAILEELEKQGVKGVEAEKLARELAAEAEKQALETGADKSVPNIYQAEAENIEALARGGPGKVGPQVQNLGLGQSEKIKRALQAAARYGRVEDTLQNEAKKDVASRFRQHIEDTVETAAREAPAGSDVAVLGEAFVPVKQRLGKTLEARDAAERGATRVAQRRGMSLSDYMAAGMGSGISEKITLGTLNNLARNRGTSAVASGSRGLARLSGWGAKQAAASPEATALTGRELGATIGRDVSPELAELLLSLMAGEQQPQDAEALIEALRR